MNRFDPARTLELYEKLHMKPSFNSFVEADCCCLVAAVLFERTGKLLGKLHIRRVESQDLLTGGTMLAALLGMTPSYANGLLCGWDNCEPITEDLQHLFQDFTAPDYGQGRADGLAARRLVEASRE